MTGTSEAGIYFEVHGEGKPLLLLHGFSGSCQDWKPSISLWGEGFRVIVADLRGHGRSGTLTQPFRHRDAAADIIALLDQLGIASCDAVGVSAGGNVLLHIATSQPERINAMVLVSATPYFPPEARTIVRQYGDQLPPAAREHLRKSHPSGDAQIDALLQSTAAFADSYDDMNFTPPLLATIRARTLIVQGDRDPLYPVELSVGMCKSIPRASLWIVPDAGHGPVFGEKWPEFIKTATAFLSR